jgi:hypothetical protein
MPIHIGTEDDDGTGTSFAQYGGGGSYGGITNQAECLLEAAEYAEEHDCNPYGAPLYSFYTSAIFNRYRVVENDEPYMVGYYPNYTHFRDANYGGVLLYRSIEKWVDNYNRTSDTLSNNNCDFYDACDAVGCTSNTDYEYNQHAGVTTWIEDSYTEDVREQLMVNGETIYDNEWDNSNFPYYASYAYPHSRYYHHSDENADFVVTFARGSHYTQPPSLWEYQHVNQGENGTTHTVTQFETIIGEKYNYKHEIPNIEYNGNSVYGKGQFRLLSIHIGGKEITQRYRS